MRPITLVKSVCFSFVVFAIAGCTGHHYELDCLKNPNCIIGKIISLDGNQAVFASRDQRAIYTFEKTLEDNIRADIAPHVAKKGELAGGAEYLLSGDFHKNVPKYKLEGAAIIKSLNLKNINLDPSGHFSDGSLDVVVLQCVKTDPLVPVFKVRVTNKSYAGSEVWIAGATIRRLGFPAGH